MLQLLSCLRLQQKAEGKPVNHQFAKEMIAGIAGGEVGSCPAVHLPSVPSRHTSQCARAADMGVTFPFCSPFAYSMHWTLCIARTFVLVWSLPMSVHRLCDLLPAALCSVVQVKTLHSHISLQSVG